MTMPGFHGVDRGRTRIPFSSYGELTTTGAVSGHLIWPDGATLNVPSASGVQMTLVSTDAQDDKDAGTGIRSVHVHYLDANLDEQTEEVQLEGLTPVTTVATDVRFIQCMHIATYGSGKKSAGVITAANGGVTYSYIATGKVRCSSSARMVPNGYKLLLESVYGGSTSSTSDAETTIRLFTTVFGEHDYTQDGIMIPLGAISSQNSSVVDPKLPDNQYFAAGTIVGFQCDTSKAATVTAGFFGQLEPVP